MITLDTIQWDETKSFEEQDAVAQVWFQKNVGEKMGFNEETGKTKPVMDSNGRPQSWKIKTDDQKYEVEVKWNYQKKNSSDWSKGRDTITIKKLT